jgi:hypothetical protein
MQLHYLVNIFFIQWVVVPMGDLILSRIAGESCLSSAAFQDSSYGGVATSSQLLGALRNN